MQEYTGPIERGMRFLWEPMKPHATRHIKVIKREINSDDEMWIETREWVADSKISGDYVGKTCWNDESRFREAVVLVVDPPEEYPDLEDTVENVSIAFAKLKNFIKDSYA